MEPSGLEPLTPHDPDTASGIVSFRHPECDIIGAQLEKEGVIVWAGDGRLRASVHFYNDSEDIERFLEVLSTITGQEHKCSTRS